MPLTRLSITNVRNLQSVSVHLSPKVNIFYGINGSGKTSILESIYLLGLGRSFRNNRLSSVINNQSKQLIVYAELGIDQSLKSLGISKNRQGKMLIKYQSEIVKSISVLASICPLQIINPDSYKLLEGGPSIRRKFMDWGVFHVEPRFFPIWKRFNRCLVQRNGALKHSKVKLEDIRIWDRELATYGESIHEWRRSYVNHLSEIFEGTLSKISDLKGITLSYYPGWDADKRLIDCLEKSFPKDQLAGHSTQGPQRADIRIRYKNKEVVNVLSRGQQKIVACALLLAQGFLYHQEKEDSCIYLIDDLSSELDNQHRRRVCDYLMKMNSQVIITAIEYDEIIGCFDTQQDLSLFHVEQGKVNPINKA